MKIAGRKNDGAWFRTNKAIKTLTPEEATALQDKLRTALINKASAAFTDITSLAAECGVGLPEQMTSVEQWLNGFAVRGIPRQVWNGRFTFTTYSEVNGKMVANYQSQIHYFAKDLRRFMKYWLLGRRQVKDLENFQAANAGNPGGIADAEADV